MKNTTQQLVKRKWTGPVEKSGKFPFGLNGLSGHNLRYKYVLKVVPDSLAYVQKCFIF